MTNEENIHNYPNSLETRVALVEMAIINISRTHDELKSHNIRLENKMDLGFSEIRKEMKSDLRLVLSIMGALSACLAGIMAHGFHWF